MSLLLYNLAKNQNVQDKLYAEIVRNLPQNGVLTETSLKQMSYVKACLKESFRMNFPLPMGSFRRLGDDIILQNYLLPKGVSYCPYSI